MALADVRNIMAAIAASGGGNFAFFAPLGTAAPAGVAGVAGVQTVTVSGTPTGGTFTLTWNGQTTAPIAYNATASAVQSALNALTGGSSITATGGPLPGTAVVVTFPARINQTTMTANGALLTGGTTPSASVAQTTPGTQSTPASKVVPGAAWFNAGWCDPKGASIKSNLSTTDIKGMGSFAILRTLTTEQKKTFDLTFLETNGTSLAVYNSLALGSVQFDNSGSVTIPTGLPQVQNYAAYFLAFDGQNAASFYCPNVGVTSQGDLSIAQGTVMDRPVTCTLYPDTSGNVLYESYTVANFAS